MTKSIENYRELKQYKAVLVLSDEVLAESRDEAKEFILADLAALIEDGRLEIEYIKKEAII